MEIKTESGDDATRPSCHLSPPASTSTGGGGGGGGLQSQLQQPMLRVVKKEVMEEEEEMEPKKMSSEKVDWKQAYDEMVPLLEIWQQNASQSESSKVRAEDEREEMEAKLKAAEAQFKAEMEKAAREKEELSEKVEENQKFKAKFDECAAAFLELKKVAKIRKNVIETFATKEKELENERKKITSDHAVEIKGLKEKHSLDEKLLREEEKKRADGLERKMREEEKERNKQQAALDSLRMQLEESKRSVKELEKRVKTRDEELRKKTASPRKESETYTSTTVKGQLAESEEKCSKLRMQLNEKDAALRQLQESAKSVDEMKTALKKSQMECSKLRLQLHEREKETPGQQGVRLAELEANLKQSESSRTDLCSRLHDKDQLLQQKDDLLNKLRDDTQFALGEASRAQQNLHNQLEAKKRETDQLAHENGQLKRLLAEAKTKLESMQKEVTDAGEKLKRSEEERTATIAHMQSEADKLQGQLKTADGMFILLNEKIDEREETIKQQEAEIALLGATALARGQEATAAPGDHAHILRRELEECKREIARLEAETEKMGELRQQLETAANDWAELDKKYGVQQQQLAERLIDQTRLESKLLEVEQEKETSLGLANKELDSLNQTITSVKREREEEIRKMNARIVELETKREEVDKERQTKVNEKAALEFIVKNLTTDKKELVKKVEETEKKVDAQDVEVIKLTTKINSLTEQEKKRKEEERTPKAWMKENKELNEKLNKITFQFEDSQEQLLEKRKKCCELKLQKLEMETNWKNPTQIQDLERHLQKVKEERNRLEEQLREEKKRWDDEEKRRKEEEAQKITWVDEEEEERKAALAAAGRKLKIAEEENEELRKTNAFLVNTKSGELHEKLQQAERTIARLESELAAQAACASTAASSDEDDDDDDVTSPKRSRTVKDYEEEEVDMFTIPPPPLPPFILQAAAAAPAAAANDVTAAQKWKKSGIQMAPRPLMQRDTNSAAAPAPKVSFSLNNRKRGY